LPNPATLQNWRFQQALYRAYYDATNRSRLLFESAQEEKALEYLNKASQEKNLPCLIVLDVNMPVMNGKELFEILKKDKEFASIPIVVFTTSSYNVDREFWTLKGIEMISKPFKHSDLARMVEGIIKNC